MSITKKINFISRAFYISALSLITLLILPVIAGAGETPFTQAQYIAETSQSNPYQALVYVLAVITGLSIIGMGYLYNQQANNLKEQFIILRDVSTNVGNLSNKIENSNQMLEKNQEILEKSLETVNNKLGNKPCLLDGDFLKDLIKK